LPLFELRGLSRIVNDRRNQYRRRHNTFHYRRHRVPSNDIERERGGISEAGHTHRRAVDARGRIAGAALDVFRDEPQVPAALMAIDNVVLAPQMGTSTREIRDERSRKLLTDLRAFLAGKPLLHQVMQ
jgi:hypothetical protein